MNDEMNNDGTVPMSDDHKPTPWDGVPMPGPAAPDPLAHLIRSETMQEHGTVEQLSALYGGLATASIDFGAVEKNATVDFTSSKGRTHYKYATLAALVTATRKPLGKNGLAVVQPFGLAVGKDGTITTMLVHEGGGRLVTTIQFQAQGDIKSLGGQTTYFRRYALCALLLLDGVDDAEDDGGNTLKNEPSGQGKQARRPRGQAPRPAARQQKAPSARASAPAQDEQPPPPSDDDAPGGPPEKQEEAKGIEDVETPTGPSGQAMTDEQRTDLRSEVGRTRVKKLELADLTSKVCGCSPSDLDSGTAVDLLRALKAMPNGA